MNVLNVQDLRKTYGPRTILGGVSFAVDEGEKVAVIGANGSGKSTLLRIVAGVEGTEGGTIAVRRGVRVGWLPQEPELPAGVTVGEAAAEGEPELRAALAEHHELSTRMAGAADAEETERLLARQAAAAARIEAHGGWDWEHRVEAMLTRVGVPDAGRRTDVLSGGERKRVALARVLLQRPGLLLLDEPTNHLDADTVEWLEEHLRQYPGAVMLVTHDRYFLDRVVGRMLEVAEGEVTPFAGGYQAYLEEKAARAERARAEDARRAKLIEQELAWARRSPSARTGKQQARLDRLADLQAERREKRPAGRTEVEIASNDAPRLGRTVLELRHVHKAYGDRVLIRDFSTRLQAGERIGVVGPNGAGKTTLLRMILGEEAPDAGEIERGVNTRVAYVDQDRAELDPERTVYETAADSDWVEVGGRRVHLRSYLERFLFPPAAQRQPVRSLSGGERNRLLLAKLFLRDANLLVLDEPTNDLDLETVRVLEEALAERAGCVLMVTHDRWFLDRVATGLVVFEGDGTLHRHVGGWELYRRLRAEREAERAAAAPPRTEAKKPAAEARRPQRPRRLSYRERRELEGMEEAILEAEARKAELEAALSDPALYAERPDEVSGLTARLDAATTRVEALYERWAELEEVRAGE